MLNFAKVILSLLSLVCQSSCSRFDKKNVHVVEVYWSSWYLATWEVLGFVQHRSSF